MTLWRIGLAAAFAATLGSCATRRPPEPEPQPPGQRPLPPRPQPPPEPEPPLPWIDAPLSPGDWRHDESGGGSSAAFGPIGQPSFVVRCEAPGRVTLARTGASPAIALTIRTSSGARAVNARFAGGALVATVPAADPFLDAMVYSRGRFSVEAAGMERLIVPAWPEPARVIEDCRS